LCGLGINERKILEKDLKEIVYAYVDWILLAQDEVQWQILVRIVMANRVP
jgi:hypothetical protein